uniref:AlNc14C80G5255 protein n=1 Tax=Albugo laibachii Nc14 TaxID=890382 RepID=F0WF61_9STRA|nr:AlNc14C80G5255 [Albugo laibachii Nc14]|eukprot:CCA19843.1 AlNc14C80G5255 [Albugo laibachii Nc14]
MASPESPPCLKVGTVMPQTNGYPHSGVGIGSEGLPTYDNITLVYYRNEANRRYECLLCLIEHTEVFLVYSIKDSIDGYVWIRQASSNILKLCIGKKCTSHAYDQHQQQMVRPTGLRQVTQEDVSAWLEVNTTVVESNEVSSTAT